MVGRGWGRGAELRVELNLELSRSVIRQVERTDRWRADAHVHRTHPSLCTRAYAPAPTAEMAADAEGGAAVAAAAGAAAEGGPSGGLPPMPTPGDSVLRQNASAPRAREQSDGNVSTGSHRSVVGSVVVLLDHARLLSTSTHFTRLFVAANGCQWTPNVSQRLSVSLNVFQCLQPIPYSI